MSHIYRYFKDGRFLTGYAPGASERSIPHGEDPGMGKRQIERSEYVVLAPKVIAKAIVVDPDDMYQETIVPAPVAQPTARLMGHEYNGGYGIPWTAGPASLASLPVPLGSLLFEVGSAVAVSLGIGGESDLFSQVLVNYHRRGVSMRIHTGIGSARGGASRNSGEGRAVVPSGRPKPPNFPGGQRDSYDVAPGPVIDVPGMGPAQLPAERHDDTGMGMHQHPGSSPLERWQEDFGALWGFGKEYLPWLF